MKELQDLRTHLEAALSPEHQELVGRLFDLLEKQVARADRLEKENELLRKRILELEGKSNPPQAEAPSKPYSLSSEDKRRRRSKRRKTANRKPGRKPKRDKLDCVRWIDIVPKNTRQEECDITNERPVWRIENGRAVRVGYRVHRKSWQATPRIPG